ncbi:DNA polymerase Y family protein [Nocardioides sp. YIM 152315]|uniref:Y-family DNA polymerase n=1 Tax=Nocardioides sp. YIM 152315 TaxID=3031760 RepID=UPI0023DC4131|nr:DNA polymerase Y family protein [Nocardioides sp. YIM 152315]MDF1602067.1 DNA polymerase Y family protein [Nocardioides sp. YIM 152315]
MVVWCPDWPVVAALADEGLPSHLPAAVFHANLVQSGNAAARSFGVRRGMRRRDAQSRCPELKVYRATPERDSRTFETVLAAVEEQHPGVAPLRPGLAALRSPRRVRGGETAAAALLAERLVELGVWDPRLGVADELFTAEQAARQASSQDCRVIAPGESVPFLRELPVESIDDAADGGDAVSLLRRLGLRTLGELADLPAAAVRDRFGPRVAWVHRVVGGAGAVPLSTRTPPPELARHVDFEPPLDNAETITFSARQTADRVVAGLAAQQLVCTEVRIDAYVEGSDDVVSSRHWLHPRWFTAADLVDRLHWQLQGGFKAGEVRAPVSRVLFTPVTVVPDAVHADGLWGGTDERVQRGIARVQGMLGHEAVVQPVLQGGRAPRERQALVPWGEKPTGLRPAAHPWPGSIPPPAPSRVLATPWPAEVVGTGGRPVSVDARGAVLGEPARFRPEPGDWMPVAAWAGPWPVEELWWEPGGRRVARFQVVGVDGRAWLMTWESPGTWWTEAAYD